MASLWLVDPTLLKRPTGTRRKIGRKPLIDLERLQAAILNGVLCDDDVWLATRGCNKDMQNLEWSVADLFKCIQSLRPADYHGAEWCEIGTEQWYACDAYAIRYDELRGCRSSGGSEFYLKFSIDEDGSLTLVMVRMHLSR